MNDVRFAVGGRNDSRLALLLDCRVRVWAFGCCASGDRTTTNLPIAKQANGMDGTNNHRRGLAQWPFRVVATRYGSGA